MRRSSRPHEGLSHDTKKVLGVVHKEGIRGCKQRRHQELYTKKALGVVYKEGPLPFNNFIINNIYIFNKFDHSMELSDSVTLQREEEEEEQ